MRWVAPSEKGAGNETLEKPLGNAACSIRGKGKWGRVHFLEWIECESGPIHREDGPTPGVKDSPTIAIATGCAGVLSSVRCPGYADTWWTRTSSTG